MKGIKWNGDYFAEKGMCSSDSKSMFSVGGLVAFQTNNSCSPDGRQHCSGVDLSSASYLLQEEITLEEFDKTEASKYNSGSYDIQTIIELRDRFTHEKCSSSYGTKQFLCSILEHENSVIPKEIASSIRIEEVRNHPGKFLHVYLVGDGPFGLAEKAGSFEEAVTSIIDTFDSLRIEMEYLEKTAYEKHALGMKFTEEGIRLAVLRAKKSYGADSYWSSSHKNGKVTQLEALLPNVHGLNNNTVIAVVSKGAYYSKPDYDFVDSDNRIPILYLGSDDNFGHPVRDCDLIIKKIVKKVQLGDGRTYCGSFNSSTLIDVFEKEGVLNYNSNLYSSWCDSQNWKESVHDYTFTRFEIESGLEGEMAEYNNRANEQKKARNAKFNDLSHKIIARFGEDVLKQILQEKGSVLILMSVISEKPDITKEEIKLALEAGHGKSAEILEVLIKVVADRPDQHKVRKVVSKADAWAYLSNAKLDYRGGKKGYFDDTVAALQIYCTMKLSDIKNIDGCNGKLVASTEAKKSESDFAILLAVALEEKTKKA